jgi:putative membrane protein
MLHRLKYLFFTGIFFGMMTSCGSGNQSAEEQATNETETVVTEENADDPLTEDATSPQDRVLLAAMSIRMQDQLSRMAQNKAESDAIKHLGQIIIASNEEALSILSNLAEATETQVPASLSTAQQQVVDSLDQLSGSEFETAFLQTLMEDQRQNIDNLESLTSETDNPIARDISQELLDIQEPQLERVQEIQDEMM